MSNYLIGIDDTDNLESRGTGFLSRSMGEAITSSGLGITGGITRHQLLFDPRVPYTSHNSSACLEVSSTKPNELWDFMVDFLLKSCATGSDCGLCMVEREKVPQSVIEWGKLAKTDLVNRGMAENLAKAEGIRLIGLTGTHDGIIGAMAGVGLRAWGNDGRFISLKGKDIRTISGVNSIANLKKLVEIHRAITPEGFEIDEETHIDLNGWMRPVLKDGLITIVLNKTTNNEQFQYQLADKEYIKSISN
ncbi:MAG TPA: hypothetical protein PL017_03615 [Tenuifilaceae bacterium]|nr:hypothetical protein [Tenuifilaceae bacterium]HPE17468.1 hypothetical protein [Tenuifilaceae bacterium]HPJ45161.1 hypothetical protein [Tenuifilaceae bacterium]HPQ33454.1 hypothetical protein [Tenuifilaceae bacterium]HRX67014.1 hypothetical protein [Tenuifilaceae bacterium]